jgi:glutaminyl-peptide cyclotransferase
MNRSRIALLLLVVFILSGVLYWYKNSLSNNLATENATSQIVDTPIFVADSAYRFIEQQVAFGPRIPNSTAQEKCKNYLIDKLKSYGWVIKNQAFSANDFSGKKLFGTNIIAQFQPEKAKRILLAAHWDARPIADKDSVRKNEPIDAANDGASGPGILLELARLLSSAKNKPNVGVDIILFDLEDSGSSDDPTGTSWALGSQYWAANLLPENYKPFYGILLDMVGAKGATFPTEGGSMQYAPGIVRNVWSIASELGYNNYFIDQDGPGITDDHTAINEIAKIQMIDIVELHPSSPNTFGAYHHTHQDNMSIIDKSTLKAVGQTLLQVLYRE